MCKKRRDDLFNSDCVIKSAAIPACRCPGPLKNGASGERVETLRSNLDLHLDLDQLAKMKMGIIICNVRRTSASTLYASVAPLSCTLL